MNYFVVEKYQDKMIYHFRKIKLVRKDSRFFILINQCITMVPR